MRVFVMTPPEAAQLPNGGRLSLCVHVGHREVRRGGQAGRLIVGEDFLSPAVVRGSPDNEKIRVFLEAKPIRDIDSGDLDE